MTAQQVFEDFILSRKLADLSVKSIIAYTQFVSPFLEYVGKQREFETITQDDINRYIATIIERPLSRSTKATYIRHIKIFLRWAEQSHEVLYNAKHIKVPKSPKKNVRIYSPDEIAAIFENIDAESDWLVLRNKCIVALMYDSGLRQSEVCGILWSKISMKNNNMIVCGKGDKERTVPLGSLTKQLLEEYKRLCPFSSDTVFLNRRGKPITCNTVKLMISKLANKLPFDLSSHKLRHNFATNFCVNQYERYGHIDIYQLMYLMGHEDIETTQRYLHFAQEIIASKCCISQLDMLNNLVGA